MLDRLRVARVLGLTRLRDLYRGYKYGWMGAIHGYVTTRTMQTLFDVGFFEELEARGRINVDAFAREKGLDAHVLGVLCNSLYAQRVLRREGWIVLVIATGVKWNDPSARTNPLNQDHQKKINPNQQRVSL